MIMVWYVHLFINCYAAVPNTKLSFIILPIWTASFIFILIVSDETSQIFEILLNLSFQRSLSTAE